MVSNHQRLSHLDPKEKIRATTQLTAEEKVVVLVDDKSKEPASCARACQSYPNRIIVIDNGVGGIEDRKYVTATLATIASSYLCAKVIIPAPVKWLSARHNRGKPLTSNLTWEDNLARFEFVNTGELAASANRHALGPENVTEWLTLSSRGNLLQEHFEILRNFTAQQQQSQINGTPRTPNYSKAFEWTLIGNFWNYERSLNKATHKDSTMYTGMYIPRCNIEIRIPPQLVTVVNKVQENIVAKTGTDRFGSLHLRRGDAVNACDTSINKMANYLSCTFQNYTRAVKDMPLLVSSDDRSTSYRALLKKEIEINTGMLVVDLDNEVEEALRRAIESGEAPAYQMNNFAVFVIVEEIRRRTIFQLQRRRRFVCNDCDSNILQQRLA